MTVRPSLFLHEEVLLLALRDKEGTVFPTAHYSFAIGGAVLAELLLRERITVEETKKNKKLVNLENARRIGDPLIDECLGKIEVANRRAAPETWVSRFGHIKDLKHRVAESLCRKKILRADEDKVLLIFTRKIYPEINPRPEKELIGRLEKAVFTNTPKIDPRTVVLTSLAHNVGLLNFVFDKRELKNRKDRIERIINGELTGKAALHAVNAAAAAVMVTCIMPVIISTTVIN